MVCYNKTNRRALFKLMYRYKICLTCSHQWYQSRPSKVLVIKEMHKINKQCKYQLVDAIYIQNTTCIITIYTHKEIIRSLLSLSLQYCFQHDVILSVLFMSCLIKLMHFMRKILIEYWLYLFVAKKTH
jgi:hypothetical protein